MLYAASDAVGCERCETLEMGHAEPIVARDGESWLVITQRTEDGGEVMARCDDRAHADEIASWLNMPIADLGMLLTGIIHLSETAHELPEAGLRSQLEGLAAGAVQLRSYVDWIKRNDPPQEE